MLLYRLQTIRSPRHTVFFRADTGLTTEYSTIRERLGPFDLVMLEVGGFHPSWGDIHLGPEHALEAFHLLGGRSFMPVHWGTFALSMHDWDQPAEVLFARGPENGAPLLMPRLGEPVEPAIPRELSAWWRAVDPGEVRTKPGKAPAKAPTLTLPKSVPWPLD